MTLHLSGAGRLRGATIPGHSGVGPHGREGVSFVGDESAAAYRSQRQTEACAIELGCSMQEGRGTVPAERVGFLDRFGHSRPDRLETVTVHRAALVAGRNLRKLVCRLENVSTPYMCVIVAI